MRPRVGSMLTLCLGAALALGCAQELEGERAPSCTDQLGCPEGTRCVDGSFCEAIPGADPPPPFEGAEVPPGPPTVALPRPGGGPALPQLDGGADLRDGGIGDGGVGRADGGVSGPDGGVGGCFGTQQLCDGFCIDVATDGENCGGCRIACPSQQQCRQGVCCAATETVCGGVCVDLERDRRNCGACGVDCGLGGECLLGTCQPATQGPDLPPGDPPFGR